MTSPATMKIELDRNLERATAEQERRKLWTDYVVARASTVEADPNVLKIVADADYVLGAFQNRFPLPEPPDEPATTATPEPAASVSEGSQSDPNLSSEEDAS